MKKLNNKLIQSIIETDFFLVENKKIKNLKLLNLSSNSIFSVLDIFELHLCLKQFIRVLQFIKKKNLLINICNSNRQNLRILELFFLKNKQSIKNSIIYYENFIGNLSNLKDFDLYVIINNENYFKNYILVSEINTKTQTFNNGTYKIFNNLNNFKKLIFFMLVLFNVLKIKSTQDKKN